MRQRENKNYFSVPFPPDPNIKLKKKKAKKFKNLRNTITDSFQSKIGWKRLRKGENKNYRSISFLPGTKQKIQKKKSKKIQKINKYSYGIISSQNRLEKDEIERK